MGEAQRLSPEEQIRFAREGFDAGQDLTVAVEEEFAILDPRTHGLVNRFEEFAEAVVGTELEGQLVGELIASEDGYTEQKMFGGIGFMIDGHMAVGVSGEGGLMIHCPKEETEALLAKPGARPFEMRGRELKGWLRVDAESVSTKRALEPWAMQSVAFARALPPKEKK